MRIPWCLALLLCFPLSPWPSVLSPVRAAEPADVSVKVSEAKVDFYAGKELVGSYHIGKDGAKPYLWPLNAPGGITVTRAWPMVKGQAGGITTDHVHQKSAWFCHGDVIPEGIELKQKVKNVEGVDFWAESPGAGKIVCVNVEKPRESKNHGRIVTANEWRTADGVKILDEKRTIGLYDLGDARLFVFDIDLHASVCPITFGDTKEGSFGVRVNDVIFEEATVDKKRVKGLGKLENAEGKTGEKALWGLASKWCDYSGPIDGKQVGIAIFDHPSNASPAHWHSRSYGLMAANPFGREKSGFPAMKGKTDLVKLAKGEHLKLRYGILLHTGDAKGGKVADYYQKFTEIKE